MTWQTPLGERVLQGTEAKFAVKLVQAVTIGIDNLDISEMLGISCSLDRTAILLDDVMSARKVYLLHWCLKALLTPEVPPAELIDAIAATIHYLFLNLEVQIEYEIDADLGGDEPDSPYRYYHRRLCWNPLVEYVLPSQRKVSKNFSERTDKFKRKNIVLLGNFSPESTDKQQWLQCVKNLSNRIICCERTASFANKEVKCNPELLPIISMAKSLALMDEISHWRLN